MFWFLVGGAGLGMSGLAFTPKGKPTSTSAVIGGRRKHHTSWEDGSEMVEEYEVGSNRLVLRKIRTKSKLGKISEWKILLGEPDKKAFNPGKDLIAMSASNPVFLQQDSPTHFQWRIRNIPYDKSVYRLSIDNKRHQIVLRTTNRKYFKRIDVASIKALGLTLSDDKSVLAYTHSNNTLVITYKKPPQVIQAEMDYAQKRLRNASGGKEEPECKQQ